MNGADAPVRAHATGQNILPVFLCGPTKLPKKSCRCSGVGPGIPAGNSQNITTKCLCGPMDCIKIMLALLCWPRQLPKKFCRCLCVGPWSCLKTGAGAPVWAQEAAQEMLPVLWCGPMKTLPVFLCRPRKLPKRFYQCLCEGPWSYLKTGAGVPVWAEINGKEMLPVFGMGPWSYLKSSAGAPVSAQATTQEILHRQVCVGPQSCRACVPALAQETGQDTLPVLLCRPM